MNELRPWIGEPPHTTPPEMPGYRQVAHERVNIGTLSIAGIALIPVWAVAFTAAIAIAGGRSEYETTFTFSTFMLFTLVVVGVIVLHEIIHGIAAALLGARPAFGIGPGFAYTTFLEPMSKAAYLTVGLAPLVVISIAAVAGALAFPSAAGWLIVAAVMNASGAIGDLWMTWRILRAPRGARFYDLADGFAVFAPVSTPS